MFKNEPKHLCDQVLDSWRRLGQLNVYDIVSLTEKANIEIRSTFDSFLNVASLSDSFFEYQGQVSKDNKRHGIGRYISLFNGSVYEGNC